MKKTGTEKKKKESTWQSQFYLHLAIAVLILDPFWFVTDPSCPGAHSVETVGVAGSLCFIFNNC